MFGTKLQVSWLLVPVILCGPTALAQPPGGDVGDVRAALSELREASFVDKERIVERLSARGDSSVRPVLAALLEDRLFVRQPDQRVFIVKSADDSLTSLDLVDPVSLAGAGSASRDDLAKVGTNNRLRKRLRTLVARFDLSNDDAAVRLAAVAEISRALDAESLALLRAQSAVERHAGVKEEIDIALALAALDTGDSRARLVAIARLSHTLRPQVRNRLASLL